MNRLAVYLGNNTALTTTKYGHKIFVDTRDVSLTPHLLMDGDWEHWITKFVNETVKDGMTAIDVGANFGWYTLRFADLVGKRGRVHAYEPHPRTFNLLRKTVEVNGFLDRVICNEVAATKAKTHMTLYCAREHQGSSALHFDNRLLALGDRLDPVSVEVAPLDEIQGQVHFIKIDAEESEPLVIEGATKLLMRNHEIVVLMEYCCRNMHAVNLMTQMNFRMFLLDEDSRQHLIGISDLPSNHEVIINLVFRR